jgi:predicted DNA-binding transcriptional regulator AlpA
MSHPIKSEPFVSFDDLPDSAFIRLHQLLSASIIPFSAATAWRRVREGSFPQPIRISPQVTAWRVADVRQWLKDPANYVTDTTSNCR